MLRKSLGISIPLAMVTLAVALVAGANTPTPVAQMSAAEIVDKNVAARGGLQAWRAVKTMSMEGTMGAGGNRRATLPTPGAKLGPGTATPRAAEEVKLPFVMDLERTRKMRLELQFNGQTAIQVFDGANGWKVRPFLNRREVESYTADEMKKASAQADLDGPLVDYAAKGTQVELVGMEKVDGRDTYKLKLTMKNGNAIHVWIDAQTFLEAKMEGQPRRLDGSDHPVEIYLGDYRSVSGLQIPHVMQTKVFPVNRTATGLRDTPIPAEKIVIEKVVVNPKLDDTLFTKPQITPVPVTAAPKSVK
jgi:hypothetical protein